jgi:hypothetical protein
MLLLKQLRVGYIYFDGIHDSSLLSPLFCNIILHELDKHVLEICKDFNNTRVKVNSNE